MNRTNKLFKDAIKSGGFRPMAKAGVYDPMEQAGHGDSILVSTILDLLKDKVVVAKSDLEELIAMAGDKDRAKALTQIEWKLKNMIPLTVRMIADRTIKGNKNYYSDDLLKLISPELLDTEIIDENLHEVGCKIDEIRFKKEEELLVMLQIVRGDNEREKIDQIINGTVDRIAGEWTQSQQEKIKEIRFLSNVAQSIIHQ